MAIRRILEERFAEHVADFDISIHTGAGSNEQFGLKKIQVDFERGAVKFPNKRREKEKRRYVPSNSVSRPAFKQLMDRNTESPWIFTNPRGDKLRGHRDWFEPAIKLAHVKDYTWHDNRHTFASRPVIAGVDLRTVAQLMGHRSIQMTMRYAHLAPDHQQNAAQRLVNNQISNSKLRKRGPIRGPRMTKQATNTKRNKVAKKLPMGIFEKVVGSQVYWILYTDKDGQRHREKCGKMSTARARLSIRRSEKARGVETIVAPAAVKFSTLIDDAIQHTASESSAAHLSIVTYMYARIRAVFGQRLVSSIKKSEIVDWLHKEATERKWSASTRNHYQYTMSKAFTLGIENEKIAIHPMKGIKRRREDNQRERQLSEAEETALRSAVAAKFPHFVAVIDFAIHSGTRASEMLRAKVGDYSPLTKMLTIHQTKVRTAPGIRYVPASPVLVDAYNELAKGKQLGEPLISKTKLQGSRDGSVAANRALKQTRYWFEQSRDDAKLVDLHWHDLRHTFASRLVAAGVPLATVSMYLGHQSIQMTMRYSHLIPGSGDAAVNALMNFYKKPVAGKAIGTNGKTVKSETAATFSVIRGGKEARTP